MRRSICARRPACSQRKKQDNGEVFSGHQIGGDGEQRRGGANLLTIASVEARR